MGRTQNKTQQHNASQMKKYVYVMRYAHQTNNKHQRIKEKQNQEPIENSTSKRTASKKRIYKELVVYILVVYILYVSKCLAK